MNNRAFSLSLLMAGFAVWMVWSYVDSKEAEVQKKFGAEVIVVKAARDIKEMETITDSMLKRESVPKKFLEPAAVTLDKNLDDVESAKQMKSLIGTVAVVPIKKEEQVTFNKLTELGARTGLAPQITPGKRAIAIPISEISGVGKLIKPGDRIDLIAVLDYGGGKDNRIVKTLFQDIVVLATGKNVSGGPARVIEEGGKVRSLAEDTSFSNITVEVDPLQAQTLALVINNADNAFTISLRNNDDTEHTNIPSSMVTDVLGPDQVRLRRPASGQR